jgi:hypothetical protein
MGINKESVQNYINKHVATIDGVVLLDKKFMEKVEKVQSDEALLKLANFWIKSK